MVRVQNTFAVQNRDSLTKTGSESARGVINESAPSAWPPVDRSVSVRSVQRILMMTPSPCRLLIHLYRASRYFSTSCLLVRNSSSSWRWVVAIFLRSSIFSICFLCRVKNYGHKSSRVLSPSPSLHLPLSLKIYERYLLNQPPAISSLSHILRYRRLHDWMLNVSLIAGHISQANINLNSHKEPV